MSGPRILIVDDHDRIRIRARALLAETWPAAVFGEAATLEGAIQIASSAPWSLVIIDIRLGDESGLALVKLLAKQRPNTPIVVLSGLSRSPYEAAALEAGAAAFISKQDAPDRLTSLVAALLKESHE